MRRRARAVRAPTAASLTASSAKPSGAVSTDDMLSSVASRCASSANVVVVVPLRLCVGCVLFSKHTNAAQRSKEAVEQSSEMSSGAPVSFRATRDAGLLSCLTPRVRYTALAAAADGVLVGASRCAQIVLLGVRRVLCLMHRLLIVGRSIGSTPRRRLRCAPSARSTPGASQSPCW